MRRGLLCVGFLRNLTDQLSKISKLCSKACLFFRDRPFFVGYWYWSPGRGPFLSDVGRSARTLSATGLGRANTVCLARQCPFVLQEGHFTINPWLLIYKFLDTYRPHT